MGDRSSVLGPSHVPPRPSLRLVRRDVAGEPDNSTLVRGLVLREEWAAKVVWNRYASLVYGVLNRALGSPSESEDLTQEVFCRVFASVGKLRDPAALRSFLYSSTVRGLRSHLRAKRVRRFLSLSDTGDVPEQPARGCDSEGRELLARFYGMLGTLGANERTAFTLRHVEGLSLQEVADFTGSSLATIKRRLHRASEQVEKLARKEPDFAEYLGSSGASTVSTCRSPSP
jgi:RNA polymerase sigma-70 factor (ECF subfamily)